MRVSFNGKTYKVPVKPGDEGAREFENEIRKLLRLPEEQEFDVIFHCKAPVTGDKLQLQGLNAFDAAVHCASVSASQRSQSKQPVDLPASSQPSLLGRVAGMFNKIRAA